MVTREAIEEALVQMLATSLNESPTNVRNELATNGGACDSIVGVEVLLAVEEKFAINIPDDALADICHSIPAMVEFVASRLS